MNRSSIKVTTQLVSDRGSKSREYHRFQPHYFFSRGRSASHSTNTIESKHRKSSNSLNCENKFWAVCALPLLAAAKAVLSCANISPDWDRKRKDSKASVCISCVRTVCMQMMIRYWLWGPNILYQGAWVAEPFRKWGAQMHVKKL